MDTDPEDEAGGEDESDARHPVPNRENVIEFLHEADHEEDLDQAGYWVNRAVAETLLLILDTRTSER